AATRPAARDKPLPFGARQMASAMKRPCAGRPPGSGASHFRRMIPAGDHARDEWMDGLAGRTLGPYELQELLGSGGFGAVYRALHLRLGHPRAVKVLAAH